MSDGLLDTSVFIAAEADRALAAHLLPDRGFVSVVTLAEIEAGVLAAQTLSAREARLSTLRGLAGLEALGIDAEVASAWARLRSRVAAAGRRANINDLWIAATAMCHALPIVTQDSDYEVLQDLGGPVVIRV